MELKRAAETRLRREVISQILDYAAHAAAYWQAGRIADSFATTMAELGRDPDAELAAFLGADADTTDFWRRMDANISAGRMKLVIVADTIPRELARIVEFLNEQIRAEVRAVELSWFEGDGSITALARDRRAAPRRERKGHPHHHHPTPDHERRMDRPPPRPPRRCNRRRRPRLYPCGGRRRVRAEVMRQQGSIVAVFEGASDTLFPLTLAFYDKGSVQLCLAYPKSRGLYARGGTKRFLRPADGDCQPAPHYQPCRLPMLRLNDPGLAEGLAEVLRHVVPVATG